jgi:hypothetical protein
MEATGTRTGFADLQYPPAGQRPHPSNLARGAGFGLAAGAAVITGGLAIGQAVRGTAIEGPGGLWGSVSFLAAISILSAFLSTIPLRIRGFRVQDGFMTLVTPVRTRSGKRVRHLPLTQIAHAERIAQPGADSGILVRLVDGTTFPIFDDDLRGDRFFLDRLLVAVSESRGITPSALEPGDLNHV